MSTPLIAILPGDGIGHHVSILRDSGYRVLRTVLVSDVADHNNVHGGIERACDFDADDNSSARQRKYDDILSFVWRQRGRKPSSRVDTVLEKHRPSRSEKSVARDLL